MPILNYKIESGIKKIRHFNRLSEVGLARKSKLSRETIRRVEQLDLKVSVINYVNVAKALGQAVSLLVHPETQVNADESIYAVSLKVLNGGPDSWKYHYMEFVDEFRKSLDTRLLILPPTLNLSTKLYALLASIVLDLCEENEIDAPDWAKKPLFLSEPWFVAGSESLKATALLESRWSYRKNNIFVQDNFLSRA